MTITTIIVIASVVFTADGSRFRWAPRYPETARRLDNSCVVRLESASQAEREACGWYALSEPMPPTGAGTAAQLMHAIRLQMAKYDRDMMSKSGRSAWHGRLVSAEIYPEELVKVEVYSNTVDGAVWRYRMPFRAPEAKRPPQPVMTNGVPAALAAARLRRQAETQGPTNVTETITAGGHD